MGMESPLSTVEIAYLEITIDEVQDLPKKEEIDHFTSPAWILNYPKNIDPIYLVLPFAKVIMEPVIGMKKP